jgi:hypothetical protein
MRPRTEAVPTALHVGDMRLAAANQLGKGALRETAPASFIGNPPSEGQGVGHARGREQV